MGESDLASCLDCGRDMAEARQLCESCTSRLRVRLGELPGLYRALEEHLIPGTTGGGPIGRTKAVDAPLPAVEDVLSLRGPGGMAGILTDWLDAFWVGKPLVLPVSVEARLNTAVVLLQRMLPGISTSHPEAGLFADEIRKLNAAVTSIVAPKPKTIRAGLCSTEVEGGECGAALRYLPGDTVITCAWCNTTYTPADWLPLYQSLRADEREAS